jgi:hypothetical protein
VGRIDHVLYGVQDLELAAGRLEAEYGLTAAGGGSHGELGTANRLIPLGDQYIELITVADPASQHPLAVVLGAWIAEGDRFFRMAIEVDDVEATAARLGSTVLDGTRTGPDGARVAFRLAGFEMALAEQVPFFIEWREGREHRLPPRRAGANPRASGVAWVELGGDVERVREWVGEDVDGLRLVGGEPGLRAIAVAIDDGEVVVS